MVNKIIYDTLKLFFIMFIIGFILFKVGFLDGYSLRVYILAMIIIHILNVIIKIFRDRKK